MQEIQMKTAGTTAVVQADVRTAQIKENAAAQKAADAKRAAQEKPRASV
jgi:hypothetical protein